MKKLTATHSAFLSFAQAIMQATRLLGAQDIEIWDLGRKIAVLRAMSVTKP
jgi:hypothetical protein